MKVTKRTFDAVIVGAGGAGLRAALQLSESGLKTAVRRAAEEEPLTPKRRADICASFQAAVADILSKRSARASVRCAAWRNPA